MGGVTKAVEDYLARERASRDQWLKDHGYKTDGNLIIVARYQRSHNTYLIDEVEVVTVDGLHYWAQREGSGETSAKIDFQSLADTLAFCGYVRMTPVP